MYQDRRGTIEHLPDETFREQKERAKGWFYTEYDNRRKSWKTIFITINLKPITEYDGGKVLLEYARPELIIYTNILTNDEITRGIQKTYKSDETKISPQTIINAYHFRDKDSLLNRVLKDN